MKDYIFKPSQFFDRNKETQFFWIPLILLILLTGLNSFKIMQLSMTGLLNIGTDSEIAGITGIVSIVSAVIGAIVGPVITVFVLWLFTHKLFKGENTFKQTFSVYAFANIPATIYSLITLILLYMTNTVPSTDNIGYLLFSLLNPLQIYTLILMVIGLITISKVKAKKIIILYVIFEGVAVATTLVPLLINTAV